MVAQETMNDKTSSQQWQLVFHKTIDRKKINNNKKKIMANNERLEKLYRFF